MEKRVETLIAATLVFLCHPSVHACMCVHLANDLINIKTETEQWICCEEVYLLVLKLDFYWGYKFYRGSCLICLIRSNGTAG